MTYLTLDIETTGLFPRPSLKQLSEGLTEDFITAIGIHNHSTSSLQIFSVPVSTFQSSLCDAEQEILASFQTYLDSNFPGEFPDDSQSGTPSFSFLTYNGVEFDIPFILSKLNLYEQHSFEEDISRIPNIDLINFTRLVSGRRLSKDEACRKLANLYVPRSSDGLWTARIYKSPSLLTENDHIEMLQHNATDLTSTSRLYNVLKNFPDFQSWQNPPKNPKKIEMKMTQ